MEVEARFAVPDLTTYEQLLALDRLDQFVFRNPETHQIDDVYLDTEDRRIAQADWACCVCHQGDQHQVIVRKRGVPDPPLHRYERFQADLSGQVPLQQWPSGPVRDQVVALVGDAELRPVLALHRTQTSRDVYCGGRRVARLKQDVVSQVVDGETQEFLDLVIALADGDTEDEFASLVASVQNKIDVWPQPVSRYQRSMAVEGEAPTEGRLLTRDEYQVLRKIACGSKRYARRACALIALHHGSTQVEAGAYAGLTDRRARYWLSEFRNKRLAIFPPELCVAPVHNSSREEDPEVECEDEAILPDVPPTRPLLPIAPPVQLKLTSGLEPDDTMTEAARKTLHFHFLAMLSYEESTRLGSDPEQLHKMRVATRRMRAAAQVFERYVRKKQMKPYLACMRETAKILGRVRDLDVAQEKAERYMDSRVGKDADLDPLLASWDSAHSEARAALIAYLDGESYCRFKEAFALFLDRPLPKPRSLEAEHKVVPELLRHVVPTEIYRRLAAVRAYDLVVTRPKVSLEDYHNLRISAKRLRYALEFFREVLGPEAEAAIDELKDLQDYLGDLQDAVVVSDRLRNFWLWGTWDPPTADELLETRVHPILAPGVARYHAEKQIEMQDALDGFAEMWTHFQGPTFSRRIAEAVSVL